MLTWCMHINALPFNIILYEVREGMFSLDIWKVMNTLNIKVIPMHKQTHKCFFIAKASPMNGREIGWKQYTRVKTIIEILDTYCHCWFCVCKLYGKRSTINFLSPQETMLIPFQDGKEGQSIMCCFGGFQNNFQYNNMKRTRQTYI